MKKKCLVVSLLCFVATLYAAPALESISIVPTAAPLPQEYVMVLTGCDWGPAITKVVLNTDRTIIASVIEAHDFAVDVVLRQINSDSKNQSLGIVTGQLQVAAAYSCDAYGAHTDEVASRYIALEIAFAPWLTDGDPFFHFPKAKNMSSVCGLRIKNECLQLLINERTAIVNDLAGQFTTAIFADDYVSLNYAWWLPPTARKTETAANDDAAAQPSADKEAKIPLIVWFHGLGEDGTNPYLPLFGTKSTNLITDTVQQFFQNGAAVLVPQSPTSWLETTTKDIFGNRIWAPADIQGIKKKITQPVTGFVGKFFTKSAKSSTEPTATVSYYTVAIKNLILQFLSAHPELDAERVYVGGCSAGGYMTINMCLQCPELFAAAFPTCGAFPDSKITHSQIEQLAHMPLWFVHARNDKTVKPETHDMATVERLRIANAQNLHYTLWDDVHDVTGTYKMQEDDDNYDADAPYQFDGHYSWIYTLNNNCTDGGVSLFEWLSQQKRKP